MSKPDLGIIGGGQLGSLLASAAKKLNIKTVILSDDKDAPAINFADEFIYGDYQDINIINNFLEKVDLVTYEFENIPYDICLLYTSPSPRDPKTSRMPSSA